MFSAPTHASAMVRLIVRIVLKQCGSLSQWRRELWLRPMTPIEHFGDVNRGIVLHSSLDVVPALASKKVRKNHNDKALRASDVDRSEDLSPQCKRYTGYLKAWLRDLETSPELFVRIPQYLKGTSKIARYYWHLKWTFIWMGMREDSKMQWKPKASCCCQRGNICLFVVNIPAHANLSSIDPSVASAATLSTTCSALNNYASHIHAKSTYIFIKQLIFIWAVQLRWAVQWLARVCSKQRKK